MRLSQFTKLTRRFLFKHFGSVKGFLVWLVVVILCIYLLDCCVFTRDRIESLLAAKPSSYVEDFDEALDVGHSRPQESDNGHLLSNVGSAHQLSTVAGVDLTSYRTVHPVLPCGLNTTCPSGQYPYFIQSGFKRDILPTVCFNGNYIISKEKKNANRGLNIVAINDKTLAVEDVRTFDVYQDDKVLLRYLKLGVQDSHLILVASLDEASYHLSKESRNRLREFGSRLISDVKFRDSFVMFGQNGLESGKAYEKLLPRVTGTDFSNPVEISGCASIPLAEFAPKTVARMEEKLKLNNSKMLEEKWCGLKEPCTSDAFPVRLYTGRENKDFPMICVNGTYVMTQGINGAGRGLNIVIVNPKTKQVIRVGHFDTFQEDSSNLEIFLEVLGDLDIILVVAFDEASTKLSDHAKNLFNELGSSMVQNVKFRDNWIFVGQKGISGFGEIEHVESSIRKWPVPIDRRLCVPTLLKGSQIKPDPIANKNDRRREFCKTYDGYGEFCDSSRVNELLTPAPLSDKTLENHAIFQVPILVVPGLNFNALRMQLETLLMNPGMRPEMVTVVHDENFEEPSALAELFSFRTQKLPSSTKYMQLFHKAIEYIWGAHPNAMYIIILEEEVIPTQDFLSFHAQCLSVVESDESLIGSSAWNENGYEKVSTLPSLVYRTRTFPGLGFLVRKSFYEKEMKEKLNVCCQNRTWNNWRTKNHYEMIVPDVSRVFRRPYEGSTGQLDLLKELLNRPRSTNLDPGIKLMNVDELTKDRYERLVGRLIALSQALATSNVDDCFSGNGLGFYIPETTGKSFSIYFEQDEASDDLVLSALCKCFGLFHAKGHRARGTHNGLLRFSYRGNMMFLVGSSTVYFKHRPPNYEPVEKTLLSET